MGNQQNARQSAGKMSQKVGTDCLETLHLQNLRCKLFFFDFPFDPGQLGMQANLNVTGMHCERKTHLKGFCCNIENNFYLFTLFSW